MEPDALAQESKTQPLHENYETNFVVKAPGAKRIQEMNLPVDSLPFSLFTWKMYIPNETGKLSEVVRSQYLMPSSITLLCLSD